MLYIYIYIYSPRCAARVVKEGSVLEGRVQVRGGVRWPHALPTWVRGREGGGFHSAASSSYGPAALPDVRPGILARQPFHGCGPPTRRSLPGPTRTPACMHGGRDRSPEERRTRHITAAVMRLHSLQVCASSHAARPGCYSAPPLSHTHSRREPGEGRRLRDGECW